MEIFKSKILHYKLKRKYTLTPNFTMERVALWLCSATSDVM